MKALLMLENGMTFEGEGFGSERDTVCEIVFNSAMCGYTELLTDPSYAGQGVVMTYPLVGNYGICYDDAESVKPWLSAFLVRSVSGVASNFRCDVDLDAYLKQNGIPGMKGLDTRALTRVLRESGTMRGMIAYGENPDRAQMGNQIEAFQLETHVPVVSNRESKMYGDGRIRVALLDYGVKLNIVRSLVKRGCMVKCFPWDASCEEILAYKPDGVMLSNGPGNPKDVPRSIEEIKRLFAHGVPIFAICMGHQLLALSQGFDTYKLKYGHRGVNHPVKDLERNRVFITSQNHGFVVDAKTVDARVAEVSHISMNDESVEGLRYKSGKAFSVQFHPEASGGPLDTGFLFDDFIKRMGGAAL